jgi:hypothetical protein
VFARATKRDANMRKWLVPLFLLTFFMAPVMDLMQQVRSAGWTSYTGEEHLSWNLASAHRDDNFYWMVVAFDNAHYRGGLWAYKDFSGFVNGLGEETLDWLISPIPRMFWPNKPSVDDSANFIKPVWISNGIVGSLFLQGGIPLVIFGAIAMGLWMGCLESVYFRPNKGDSTTLGYALLMVITLSLLRDPSPWVTIDYVMTVLVVAIGARALPFSRGILWSGSGRLSSDKA